MTQSIKYFMLLLCIILPISAAHSARNNNYWQCTSNDASRNNWMAKSEFQRAAMSLAFALCKKESSMPATCKSSVALCQGFNQHSSVSQSNTAMWRCTSLDEAAQAWRSTLYSSRDDAALGAKAFCKNQSSVPATCYTNLITCINMNED